MYYKVKLSLNPMVISLKIKGKINKNKKLPQLALFNIYISSLYTSPKLLINFFPFILNSYKSEANYFKLVKIF